MSLRPVPTGLGSARSGLAWFRARRGPIGVGPLAREDLAGPYVDDEDPIEDLQRTLPTQRSVIVFMRGACGAGRRYAGMHSARNASSNIAIAGTGGRDPARDELRTTLAKFSAP